MFEFVRTHNRLLQFLLLVLILPSFVVFGIQGYTRFTEGANAGVAVVDGQKVTQAEWDYSHQQQVERLRRQMPNVDAKVFDSAAARSDTLDALIRERVLHAAAIKAHLAVTDDRLQRSFVNDPQFAVIRNADGSVNKDMLAAQGMTSEGFAAQLRQDLLLQQVMGGITGSVLAPKSTTAMALDALLQRRAIHYARFDAKDYAPKINPGDAEIEAYYKAHQADFGAPEQATIDYVVLDLEVLKKGIAVPEDELKKYYAENASRYTAKEERRVRHILVKVDAGAPADVRQKAKARAEALLAEVRKAPASFADVARKNSDDSGSAAQGGDLDFFGRGAMVKPFEDAAFAMKVGEISNLVETEFGWHILKLEAVRGGEKRPFEEVRPGIEDEVRKQLATKRWAEAAEQFTNTVYEQSDSLKPVIDKLKLEKHSATVQRTPTPGAPPVLASPKLLEAIFGNEVLRNKRNTDAIEVGPNQLASARVTQYQPAHTLALAEVRDAVRQRVVAEQSQALARKDGEARLAQAKADPAAAALPLQATVARNKTEALPAAAITAVLSADASKLPAVVGIELPGQGYMVARIDQVQPRDLAAEEGKALDAQLAQAWARAESDAYYQALKKRLKAEKHVSAAAADAPASAAKP
jgi:peptidyl-prolyl cis-trans isomerase D